VIVDEVIAWLKAAVTVVEMAAVVLALSGATAVIVGGGAVAVVNDQLSLAANAVFTELCTPVVIVAV
jgi:siroheme synthase (precorrin-2 oxidase/ferrochelatase)